MMNTFEEQFPSLKGKRETLGVHCKYGCRPMDTWAYGTPAEDGLFLRVSEVQEKCLDKQRVKELDLCAERLWVVLANVSNGDWKKQSKEWQMAAARARDEYFAKRKELGLE